MFQPRSPSRASASLFLTAFVVAIASVIAAPNSARAQTTIEGNHLENTKVGFGGFRLDMPHNYTAYTAVVPKSEQRVTYAEHTKRIATAFDSEAAWATTSEVISFGAPSRGISLAVVRIANEIPPLKKEKEYLRMLDIVTSWGFQRADGIFLRDQRKIGDIHIGRVARAQSGSVSVICIVLVPPRTSLTFVASGPETAKDDVLADLDAVLATLEVGAKKKL